MMHQTLVNMIKSRHPGRLYVRLKKSAIRAIDRVRLRGNQVSCPICASTAKSFKPQEICAFCGSRPRQRLLWQYLRTNLRVGDCVLHIAPEPCLQTRLRAIPGVGYISCDLDSIFADVHLDLTSWDETSKRLGQLAYRFILFSHVLEHIPDDIGVLKSLARLLRPGGQLLVQVPIDPGRPTTYEDWTITTPEARTRAFGQCDHVRVYGQDFQARLASAGYQATELRPLTIADKNIVDKMHLATGGSIFVCSPGPNSQLSRDDPRLAWASPPVIESTC